MYLEVKSAMISDFLIIAALSDIILTIFQREVTHLWGCNAYGIFWYDCKGHDGLR